MLAAAKDIMACATAAKFLRLGGFDDTANLLVAPQRRSRGRIDRQSLQQMLARAREELAADLARSLRTSVPRDGYYRSRGATFDLVKPVGDDANKFRSVHLRQDISRELVERLLGVTIDQVSGDDLASVLGLTSGLTSVGDSGSAKLEFGPDLRLEIDLQQ